MIEAGVSAELLLQDYFRKLSLEDLETMEAILRKYRPPDIEERTERGKNPVRQQLSSG